MNNEFIDLLADYIKKGYTLGDINNRLILKMIDDFNNNKYKNLDQLKHMLIYCSTFRFNENYKDKLIELKLDKNYFKKILYNEKNITKQLSAIKNIFENTFILYRDFTFDINYEKNIEDVIEFTNILEPMYENVINNIKNLNIKHYGYENIFDILNNTINVLHGSDNYNDNYSDIELHFLFIQDFINFIYNLDSIDIENKLNSKFIEKTLKLFNYDFNNDMMYNIIFGFYNNKYIIKILENYITNENKDNIMKYVLKTNIINDEEIVNSKLYELIIQNIFDKNIGQYIIQNVTQMVVSEIEDNNIINSMILLFNKNNFENSFINSYIVSNNDLFTTILKIDSGKKDIDINNLKKFLIWYKDIYQSYINNNVDDKKIYNIMKNIKSNKQIYDNKMIPMELYYKNQQKIVDLLKQKNIEIEK